MVPSYGTHIQFPRISEYLKYIRYLILRHPTDITTLPFHSLLLTTTMLDRVGWVQSKVSTVPYNTHQLELGVLVQLASTYCSVLSFNNLKVVARRIHTLVRRAPIKITGSPKFYKNEPRNSHFKMGVGKPVYAHN
jgi:hypothetical protein